MNQAPGARPRRWFQSAHEDLIVWFEPDGSIYGFQLCYDREGNERALTWTPEHGYAHNRIDAGDRDGLRHKRSPVLVADGAFDAAAMAPRFREASALLPAEIREFVGAKLDACGAAGASL